jgi:chitinase
VRVAALIVACTVVLACGRISFDGLADAPIGSAPVTVGFAQMESLEDEVSGTAMVRVVLSAPSDVPVTVGYGVVDGSATRGDDYVISGSRLAFAPGELEQVIEIAIANDGREEMDETIRHELSSVTGGATLGASMHLMTISADILARINYTVTESQGLESGGPVMLVVALDMVSTATITVGFTPSGSAQPGVDHLLDSGILTFPPGTTTQSVALGTVNDMLDENDETVVVQLVNPTNAILGEGATRTHTIFDDDDPPSVTFAAVAGMTSEAGISYSVTVSLSAPSGRPITVPFARDAASTASMADITSYSASPLTFDPGTTSKPLGVMVANDLLDEDDETLILDLGAPTNATIGTTASHTLTITDEDAPPLVRFDPAENNGAAAEGDAGTTTKLYTLVLSAPSGKVITVTIAFGGNAATPQDYAVATALPVQFAPGQTSRQIQLSITGDALQETDDVISMQLASPTNATIGAPPSRQHTITNDD